MNKSKTQTSKSKSKSKLEIDFIEPKFIKSNEKAPSARFHKGVLTLSTATVREHNIDLTTRIKLGLSRNEHDNNLYITIGTGRKGFRVGNNSVGFSYASSKLKLPFGDHTKFSVEKINYKNQYVLRLTPISINK